MDIFTILPKGLLFAFKNKQTNNRRHLVDRKQQELKDDFNVSFLTWNNILESLSLVLNS